MNILDSIDDKYFENLKPMIEITDEEIEYIKTHRDSPKISNFLISLQRSFYYNNIFGYSNLKLELNKIRKHLKK
jgi:hypothetical protein